MCDEYLNNNKTYFQELIKMQKAMTDDNMEVNEFIEILKNSNFLSSKSSLLAVLNSLNHALIIRPRLLNLYIHLIHELKEAVNIYFNHDEIFHIFRFAPDSFRSTLFSIHLINKYDKENESNNEIVKALFDDNVEEFQSRISMKNQNINGFIPKGVLHAFDGYLSLIEAAAVLGSTSIFKFLIMNFATVTPKLADCAIFGGNYEIIHILENETSTFKNSHALEIAIYSWRFDLIQYLTDLGSNIYTFNALYECVQSYNLEILIHLIKEYSKRKVNDWEFSITDISQDNNRSLMHIAVNQGFLEIIKIFIYFFTASDLNKDDQKCNYPIHYALYTHNYEIVKILCNIENIDLTVTDGYMRTPLMIAAEQNNTEIIQMICAFENININAQDFVNQITATHLAVKNNNIRIVEMLLKKPELDIKLRDKHGLSPLFYAIDINNVNIIKLLVEYDPEVINVFNNTQTSPLTYALNRRNNKDIIEYFLSLPYIEINRQNKFGIAPIHLAVKTNITILKMICNTPNIDINLENNLEVLFYYL